MCAELTKQAQHLVATSPACFAGRNRDGSGRNNSAKKAVKKPLQYAP